MLHENLIFWVCSVKKTNQAILRYWSFCSVWSVTTLFAEQSEIDTNEQVEAELLPLTENKKRQHLLFCIIRI